MNVLQMSAPAVMVPATPGTPLARAQEARGYQQAFFILRALAATKAHLMPLEPWERLVSATQYCADRYYEVLHLERPKGEM